MEVYCILGFVLLGWCSRVFAVRNPSALYFMGLTRLIALDIIWDTTMNTKLFGAWLSVR